VTTAPAEALPTSDPAPATLSLPGGPLSYVDEGPRGAPAVLCLHGIPGSVRDFRYLAPQLTDRLRVVRVDLPGFGGSAAVPSAIDDLSERARRMIALADHLDLDRFAVLGHSMGGASAIATAADHQRRVRLLVLVASVALSLHRGLGMPPWAFGLAARGLAAPLLGPLLVRWARALYRRRRFPGADGMDAESLGVQFRSIAALDFRRTRRIIRRGLPPVLLAYARDDHMVETEISEELARALPEARVLRFDQGGHNLQKTRAVELAGAIKESLAGP
jgi:pimeloyl-ACP methyl ester carboxylesterase